MSSCGLHSKIQACSVSGTLFFLHSSSEALSIWPGNAESGRDRQGVAWRVGVKFRTAGAPCLVEATMEEDSGAAVAQMLVSAGLHSRWTSSSVGSLARATLAVQLLDGHDVDALVLVSRAAMTRCTTDIQQPLLLPCSEICVGIFPR